VPSVVELGYSVVYVPILGVMAPIKTPPETVERIDTLIARICRESDFQTKMRNIPLQIMYENSATFEKTNLKYKDDVYAFFKEEGLVK
jgi:tripartite-type tricarboxylate transporter receptor subunit TctC